MEKFIVCDPAKVGSTVKYTVAGVDEDGDFRCNRRFKEFHALSVQLRTRWPGVYIPSMPEKKLMNNTDSEVVEERRQLLQKFLKDCAKYDYIIYSKEFKIFSRGDGEIDKALFALPRQTPVQVIEKYRLNFKINEAATEDELRLYSDNIQRFVHFLKKAIPAMQL